MRTLISTFALVALSALLPPIAPAQAAPVTFVASTGSDANPCTRAQPCASWFGAGGVTDAGGEVICLDSGPYGGNVLFSKSITIDCAGGTFTSNFTAISEGTGLLVVRNVRFSGISAAAGSSGLLCGSGATCIVENCVFENWATAGGFGIEAQTGATLIVRNTVITHSGSGATGGGVHLSKTGGGATLAEFNRVEITDNVNGIVTDSTNGPLKALVRDSVISLNNRAITASSGLSQTITIEHSSVYGNCGNAIEASGANTAVILSKTSIQATCNNAFNATGGAVIFSYGDNPVNSNNGGLGTAPIVIGLH